MSNLPEPHQITNQSRRSRPPDPESEPYNIIPVHNLLADHPSLRYPEVRAAAAALRSVGDLRRPPFARWQDSMDLLDWLALFFGFQADNVRNQREHLVLHLANAQMRLTPPPDSIDSLDSGVLRRFQKKLLKNYSEWCYYLGKKSNIWISDRCEASADGRRELLYVALYLLVWGESANLRLVPECICYIFHHMAMELNKIMEDYIDENTGQPVLPSYSGENAFLNRVVRPIYDTIKAEVESSRNGTARYSAWRNYDDVNEYFWSKRCFEKLKWPIDKESNFFAKLSRSATTRHVGKTGFVERRSFWSLYRSFDRVWIMHALFLQAVIIVAWDEPECTWQTLREKDVQVRILSVFVTWSAMRLLRALLDAATQIGLVSGETKLAAARMLLRSSAAAAWALALSVFYVRLWMQRNWDQGREWSRASEQRAVTFWAVALGFVLHETLAAALFAVPWIGSFVETSDLRIISALLWWFRGRIFVGRGMREGLVDRAKYVSFWTTVLATKFCVSYFLQIKPMVRPTKTLLGATITEHGWHVFLSNSNGLLAALLWLPVVMIYFVDLQIWYAVFTSLVGVAAGLLAQLGEIRNIQQLGLRFQFFASAIQFNLMPEEQLFNERGTARNKFNDAVSRLKLRYVLGRPYKKIESSQIEANKFALIWNEIISIFREEDIISDRELELLELPGNAWNVRVIRWPCFLLCNELLVALSQADELVDATDKYLWHKICKSEYRRCAVIEAYDSVKHLVLSIVKRTTKEHSILTVLFQEIDQSLSIEKFTKTFKTTALFKLYKKLIKLVELLNEPRKDVNKVVNTLQAMYEIVIQDFLREKRSIEQLKEDGLAPQNPSSASGLLFENAVRFPDHREDQGFNQQIRRLYSILACRVSMQNVPSNPEARRRIAFFSNSLFMSMPRAPQVKKMMAFSVLTPYYDEDVLYSKEQLRKENEDGISVLYYLQTVHPDEWENFIERMRRQGLVWEEEIWTSKLTELRLWASFRGQTLARTVRGMMYYHRALNLLSFLDSADGNREDGAAAAMKFAYVLGCQIYAKHKDREDPKAEDILYLMKTNEALRVAYVDEVLTGRDGKEYYSVLAKYDKESGKEVEIYRIKLPGPMKIGEGKPENQNNAVVFTRGDAVQTIDMNQDNYFEEALKMRNLLQEFSGSARKPKILGVREHIFTGPVSTLAWFMSSQETSFVTLGHRVFANVLKIRMHYGHPDVFDRFWFLTRGGLSKASRTININEDIFAGFNCTLRGGSVTHHEYIQVGKGRDVGLNQISVFEAKIAAGSAEQALSRDVYRLGQRLDFFRTLSFFYTTVGFFSNTTMFILILYAFLWSRLYLALSGIESFIVPKNSDMVLGTILNQEFVIQLGLFTVVPMILESSLERGFIHSAWESLMMQLQLSSVFYAFSVGTRSHFFGRTLLHGGNAKYRPTNREFAVHHSSFAENYRLYARSHFVKAVELGLVLVVYARYSPTAAHGSLVYTALTISSWFLVISWIMAPFVFNPSGFDWLKTVDDFDDFMNWIWFRGSVLAEPKQSWERWWYEEQEHLRTTGIWGKLLEVILDLRFFFFQYGIVYQLDIAAGSTSIAVYLLSWIYIFVAFGIYVVVAYARNKYEANDHIYYRLVQFLVISLAILVIIALLEFTEFTMIDIFTSLLAFVPTGWGLLLIAQVFRPFLQRTVLWEVIVSVARLYDILFGVIIMAPVALLSWLPWSQSMQTRILFNEAFSRGLRVFQIITANKHL